MARLAPPTAFTETGPAHAGTQGIDASRARQDIGDITLARRDMGTSYHLSVVVDDAEQRITHVTRGEDLFEATRIHVILQRLLGLPTPVYHHHRLIRDENGKRLAKRDDARALRLYRAEGVTPQEIRRKLGL
jgi:glutamyl-Q tRNA(Asp) synthetase